MYFYRNRINVTWYLLWFNFRQDISGKLIVGSSNTELERKLFFFRSKFPRSAYPEEVIPVDSGPSDSAELPPHVKGTQSTWWNEICCDRCKISKWELFAFGSTNKYKNRGLVFGRLIKCCSYLKYWSPPLLSYIGNTIFSQGRFLFEGRVFPSLWHYCRQKTTLRIAIKMMFATQNIAICQKSPWRNTRKRKEDLAKKTLLFSIL